MARPYWILVLLVLAVLNAGTSAAQDNTPHRVVQLASEEEISFRGAGGATLAGTLSYPAHTVPAAKVILLGPAGPNDRDLSFGGHRAFAVFTDTLVDAGYAVYRWDDRGVGASTGDWQAVSYEDMASDVLAAVQRLDEFPSLSQAPLVLIGLSEGAAVAMLAAAQMGTDVAALVLMSPPGNSGIDALSSSLERSVKAMGIDDATADAYRDLFIELVRASRAAAHDPDALPVLESVLASGGRALFPPYGFVPREDGALARLLASPWYQSQLDWDPTPLRGKIQAPVLVIGGRLDLVLPPAEHHPPLQALLGEAAQFQVLEGASHLMQAGETGMPQEYASIPNTVSPEVLSLLLSELDRMIAHDSRE